MSSPFAAAISDMNHMIAEQKNTLQALPADANRAAAINELERMINRRADIIELEKQWVLRREAPQEVMRQLSDVIAAERKSASSVFLPLFEALETAVAESAEDEAETGAPPVTEDRLAESLALPGDKPALRLIRRSKRFEDTADEYVTMFRRARILPDRLSHADAMCGKIITNRHRYEALEARTAIPWYFIAIVHALECSCRFDQHLHNGDPLDRPTVRVPAGRPAGWSGGPWEDSAADAMECLGFTGRGGDWSLARMLWRLERYNGFGYRNKGLPSPYLWSFSDQYERGKYVADGRFDPQAVSRQVGAAVLLLRLIELGHVSLPGEGLAAHAATAAGTAAAAAALTAAVPRWMEIARAETGVKEVPGAASHPRILEYLQCCDGVPAGADDETPWCSAFANFCMSRAGLTGTRSLGARSWLKWGRAVELQEAQPGDVVVLWREDPESWKGHVGFYDGRDGQAILLLGGNQQNTVNVRPYPRERLLGVRRPG